MGHWIGWIIFLLFCLSGVIGMGTLVFLQRKLNHLYTLHRALRMSLNDVLSEMHDSREATREYLPLINQIRADTEYIKVFCEEYTWRLVHFTDDELAYLAEGERLRQERIEHERNGSTTDPIVEWGTRMGKPTGLDETLTVQVVREQIGGQDLRNDTRLEVPNWRTISTPSSHSRGWTR